MTGVLFTILRFKLVFCHFETFYWCNFVCQTWGSTPSIPTATSSSPAMWPGWERRPSKPRCTCHRLIRPDTHIHKIFYVSFEKKGFVLRCKKLKSKFQHKRERCDSSLSSTMEPTPRCWTLHLWWWHEIQRTRGRAKLLTHTDTQTTGTEEGSGSLSECKAAKKLLNAFISNVFLRSYHRIMGKNSATSNTKRSSQISFSLMRKQYLKMTSIIYDCDCAVSVVLGCATLCFRHCGKRGKCSDKRPGHDPDVTLLRCAVFQTLTLIRKTFKLFRKNPDSTVTDCHLLPFFSPPSYSASPSSSSGQLLSTPWSLKDQKKRSSSRKEKVRSPDTNMIRTTWFIC